MAKGGQRGNGYPGHFDGGEPPGVLGRRPGYSVPEALAEDHSVLHVTAPEIAKVPAGNQEGHLSAAAEDQLLIDLHKAYLQVGQAAIERALTRANIVLTSATATVTAYTVLLGLVYSNSRDRPLPAIALWPVAYLAVAISFTAFYAGYLRPREEHMTLLRPGASLAAAEDRLVTFERWVFGGATARAWVLRSAIVSLSIGLMLLPAGFVEIHGTAAILISVLPAVALCAYVAAQVRCSLGGRPLSKDASSARSSSGGAKAGQPVPKPGAQDSEEQAPRSPGPVPTPSVPVPSTRPYAVDVLRRDASMRPGARQRRRAGLDSGQPAGPAASPGSQSR